MWSWNVSMAVLRVPMSTRARFRFVSSVVPASWRLIVAARMPRMITTTMSSIRVKPAERRLSSIFRMFNTFSTDRLAQPEDREEEAEHHEPHHRAHEEDQGRSQERDQRAGPAAHLPLLHGRHPEEHLVEAARLLADRHHLDDSGGEEAEPA